MPNTQAAIHDYLPWLLSAITIWMTVLAGNKHKSAWLVGLCNQGLWLIWIIVTGTWGLVPMNLALWAVYARNHWKWKRQEEFPAKMSEDLAKMLKEASEVPMTPEMIQAQRRSWVLGEMMLDHPEMTEDQVNAIIDRVLGIAPTAK